MPDSAVLLSNKVRVSVGALNSNRKNGLLDIPSTTELPLSSRLLVGSKTDREMNCKKAVEPDPDSEIVVGLPAG